MATMSTKRSRRSQLLTDQDANNTQGSEKEKDQQEADEQVIIVPAPSKVRTKKSSRPTKTDPLIPIGTTLHRKFKLTEIIGAGGYGQIYKAFWPEKQVWVAVKVMTRKHEPQRMILEQRILHHLLTKPHFPQMFASGTFENTSRTSMFIVMELLGRSLSDLRKKCEGKHFDAPTAIRAGMQAMESLKTLHELGYVHRDIKPGNMCCGYSSPNFRTVYVVDFGLSRKYRVNGKVLRRNVAGFRGTMRYVSLNVHERKDQGRGDDLVSLFYSIIEMSEGILPWTKIRDGDDIARKKKMCKAPELCLHQPEELYEYYSYCYDMYQEPDVPAYDQLYEILKSCLPLDYDMASPMSYESILMVESVGGTEHTGDEHAQ